MMSLRDAAIVSIGTLLALACSERARSHTVEESPGTGASPGGSDAGHGGSGGEGAGSEQQDAGAPATGGSGGAPATGGAAGAADTGAAGAAGAQDRDMIPVPDCDGVESVSLFDCNVELCLPVDVRTVSTSIDLEAFDAKLRELLFEWVDESCFETCEPPVGDYDPEYYLYECYEAECTTDRGATLSYSLFGESACYEGCDNGYENTTEHIHVQPPSDEAGWTEVEYIKTSSASFSDYRDSWVETLSVSWTGSLRPNWPSDFAGELERSLLSYLETDGGSGWSVQNAGCEVEYSEWDDPYGVFKGATLTRGDQALTVSGETQPWLGYMNDECIGAVHPSTFELIGPCPDMGL